MKHKDNERFRSFHPSQLTNTLLAEYIWNMWATQAPNFLPPANPHNGLIAQMFGDQGGYSPKGK
jgi:hypothetical protein